MSHSIAYLGKLLVRDGARENAAFGTAEFGDALTGGREGQTPGKASDEE